MPKIHEEDSILEAIMALAEGIQNLIKAYKKLRGGYDTLQEIRSKYKNPPSNKSP